MKSKFILSITIFFFFVIFQTFSQENCKVLKPEISGIYKGECKNGLANGKGIAEGIDKYEGRFKNGLPHGKGKYTWASGDTYNGHWGKGMKHGEGVYKFKNNEGDSILTGIWENDIFIKKIMPPPYKVFIARDFDKYSINKTNEGNKVSLKFRQLGMQNNDISNFTFFVDNGSYQKVGNTHVYTQVMFPVQVKITYTTKNKLKTADISPVLELIINEPGDWEIVLNN
ncbi:MAG: hypothetical protein AB9842_00730 [Bacteroidales bacterium]